MLKKLLFTIFCFFLSVQSFAQNPHIWTYGNPVWHYDYWNVGEQGFIRIEQEGEVTVGGHVCQNLYATKYRFWQTGPNGTWTHDMEPYIYMPVYVSGDTVFYWDQNHFSVLYDFSAQTGDSWLLKTGGAMFQCSDTSYTRVDDVQSVQLGNENAIRFSVSDSAGSGYGIAGLINSRFGAMGENYLFPFMRNCDPNTIVEFDMLTFKCFEDDSLSYNPSGIDCEYMLHVGVTEQSKPQIKMYPNPGNEFVFIESPSTILAVRIIDLSGNEVAKDNTQNKEYLLNTSKLNDGVYLIEISGPDFFQILRFVKEQ